MFGILVFASNTPAVIYRFANDNLIEHLDQIFKKQYQQQSDGTEVRANGREADGRKRFSPSGSRCDHADFRRHHHAALWHHSTVFSHQFRKIRSVAKDSTGKWIAGVFRSGRSARFLSTVIGRGDEAFLVRRRSFTLHRR